MRKLAIYLTAVVMLMAAMSLTSLAQGKSKTVTVTLNEDTLVNDTLIKKGEYRARVNFEAGEVSLFRNGDLVITAKGRIVEGKTKSDYTAVTLTSTDKGRLLTGMFFDGEKRSLVLNETVNNPVTDEE